MRVAQSLTPQRTLSQFRSQTLGAAVVAAGSLEEGNARCPLHPLPCSQRFVGAFLSALREYGKASELAILATGLVALVTARIINALSRPSAPSGAPDGKNDPEAIHESD